MSKKRLHRTFRLLTPGADRHAPSARRREFACQFSAWLHAERHYMYFRIVLTNQCRGNGNTRKSMELEWSHGNGNEFSFQLFSVSFMNVFSNL